MTEIVVVGSGAAGAAAVLELVQRGVRPLLLDVGHTPGGDQVRAEGNLYTYRQRHDSFDLLIGQRLSGLEGLFSEGERVAKLDAPNMRFITEGAHELGPLRQVHFDAIQSFAMGGLGNGWGAGLYRFVDADLEGFPIRAADLDPYHDKLTAQIGISGAEDDLTPHFGATGGLLPPLRLSYNAGRVYRSYLRRRQAMRGRGLIVGHPRVGVLSVEKDGRAPCDYSNLEFWQLQPYLYTPAITVSRLVDADLIDYRRHTLVRRWTESADGITVHATDARSGEPMTFRCRALVLAAGAINTARLALESGAAPDTRLPLLENPILLVPMVLPASIGRRLDRESFGLVQLNLVWQAQNPSCLLQGSLIELTAPMRSEFFGRFPLSARANLQAARLLLPAMLLMQLYFPASVQQPASVSLDGDGRLHIEGHPHRVDVRTVAGLLRNLRALGLWTHAALVQQPVTGHAIHYAGTLPMQRRPGPFQCDPGGKLHGWRGVYVADSATFSSLPAKNMSLGMMANAMRIAAAAVAGLGAAP